MNRMSPYFQHENSLQPKKDEEQSSVIKNMKVKPILLSVAVHVLRKHEIGEHIAKLFCGYFATVDFGIG